MLQCLIVNPNSLPLFYSIDCTITLHSYHILSLYNNYVYKWSFKQPGDHNGSQGHDNGYKVVEANMHGQHVGFIVLGTINT